MTETTTDAVGVESWRGYSWLQLWGAISLSFAYGMAVFAGYLFGVIPFFPPKTFVPVPLRYQVAIMAVAFLLVGAAMVTYGHTTPDVLAESGES